MRILQEDGVHHATQVQLLLQQLHMSQVPLRERLKKVDTFAMIHAGS
jgi:hypothetical protein